MTRLLRYSAREAEYVRFHAPCLKQLYVHTRYLAKRLSRAFAGRILAQISICAGRVCVHLLNRLEQFESVSFHIKTAKQEDVRSVSLLTNLISLLCASVIYLLRVSRE